LEVPPAGLAVDAFVDPLGIAFKRRHDLPLQNSSSLN
jgi:hypothetical protein